MSIIQTGRPERWFAAGLAAGLVLLAGCGSSADPTSPTGGTTSTADSGDPAATAGADADGFVTCMSENGVTIERPSGAPPSGAPQGAPPDAAGGPPSGAPQGALPKAGGGTMTPPEGVDDATWKAALDACKDLVPAPPSGSAPPTKSS